MSETRMTPEGVEYRIERHVGDITLYQTGWVKELNLVSWNGAPAKYDIRDWSPDHERMTRGLTLFEDELRTLVRISMPEVIRGIPDLQDLTGGELNG